VPRQQVERRFSAEQSAEELACGLLYRLSALLSRPHNAATERPPQSLELEIRVFSSGDHSLGALRRISRTFSSSVPFGGGRIIGLVLVPLCCDDAPKTLQYANCSNCPMSADDVQFCNVFHRGWFSMDRFSE
jgi:hypothetical protein